MFSVIVTDWEGIPHIVERWVVREGGSDSVYVDKTSLL